MATNIKVDVNDLCVLIDFDHTITSEFDNDVWESIIKSSAIAEEHRNLHMNLDEEYGVYLNDTSIKSEEKIKIVEKWYKEALELFSKYNYDDNLIPNAINESQFELRKGFVEFSTILKENKVPVFIVSASIKEGIECILKNNNLLFNNVKVISNSINNKNRIITTINKEIIYHDVYLRQTIEAKAKVLLIGNLIEDIMMVKDTDLHKSIKIGFCNTKNLEHLEKFRTNFDIVLTKQDNFFNIIDILMLKNKSKKG